MRLSFSFCFILFFTKLFSQHYDFSAGIKLDDSFIALTAQKRIANQTTLEVMIPLTKNDISLVMLGKQHYKLLGKRLNLYAGGGFHIANNFKLGNMAGLDVIGGAEYTFFFIPYTIAFDFRPYVDFKQNYSAYHLQSGLSIRYIIDEREPLKDWMQKIFKNKKWKEMEF